MSDFNQTTIQSLLTLGILKQSDIDKLEKKVARAQAKNLKDERQSLVNEKVMIALEGIEEGILFKHRQVWESVGRESF